LTRLRAYKKMCERFLTLPLNNCTSYNNYCGGVDMDTSGAVNLVDFSIFAQHWLEEM